MIFFSLCVLFTITFNVRSGGLLKWQLRRTKSLVPDHIYVPKHEIIPKSEAEEVLKKYNCKPTELPLIFVNDPAIMGLGVKPGDVIKITQKKPNSW